MISKTKVLAMVLGLAIPFAGTACAPEERNVERWATTENTNVKIDWDKVNQAYKDANGPEDLEKRLNEIYEGDEIISIAVKDETDKTQVVTGFFDKNKSGNVDEGEAIFTIKRSPTAEGAQYQTTGHGHYAGYTSPFFGIASGMLMGAMLSSMFMPTYMPVVYATSAARVGDLHSQRSSYRAANPQRFGPRSQSGRQYGGKSGTSRPSSGGGRRGGGGFGLRRAGRAVRPQRLTA
jgi:hypothetical protein